MIQPVTNLSSRTVDWWSVHQFVLPLLDRAGSWPLAGSLAWQELDDDDPVKIASLYDAAQHHILRIDTTQEALAQASQEISKATDWSRISIGRSSVYIPRRAA